MLFRKTLEARRQYDIALATLNEATNNLKDCWEANIIKGLVKQRILCDKIPSIIGANNELGFNILNDGSVVIPLEEGDYERCEAVCR